MRVPPFASIPVAAASAHGCSDSGQWGWYLTLALPAPPMRRLNAAFFVASVAHFGADVGAASSALLHVAWAALEACGAHRAAWGSFVLFYACVHARPVLERWRRDTPRHAAVAVLAAGMYGARAARAGGWVVGPRARRLVVAHALAQGGCSSSDDES